MASKKV